jgi:small basic protein (TIGR04137 family)
MSIDKSLRRKNSLQRARSVLTRGERIKTLMESDRWQEGRSPFNLPKVRVIKIVTKKGKPKEKAAEGEGGAAAEGAAPAAEGAAPAAKGAAKPAAKTEAKPGGKK